jgi:hypothetical protein
MCRFKLHECNIFIKINNNKKKKNNKYKIQITSKNLIIIKTD